MEKDDIAENINGDAEVENPKKAAGEKNNEYKVNHVLRLREYGDDIVGDLVKSGLTRYQFRGLEFPVREGVTSIVEEFVAAEESGEEPDLDEDVKVLRGN